MEIILLSIIIPVFNGEKYIKKALDSILKQKNKDIEIICINDGSKDSSLEILKSYEKEGINIINQDNKGAAISRNRGLLEARGEYIFFMDSDDIIEGNFIDDIRKFLEKKDLDMIIFGHKEFVEDDEENFTSVVLEHFDEKILDGKKVCSEYLKCKILGTPWNKIFKKNVLKDSEFKFEEGRYIEDWYPIFKATYNAKRIKILKETYYRYRIRKDSLMGNKKLKHIKDYKYATDNIKKFSREKSLGAKDIEIFNEIVFNNLISMFSEVSKGQIDRKDIIKKYLNHNVKIKKVMNLKLSKKVKIENIFWKMNIYWLWKKVY